MNKLCNPIPALTQPDMHAATVLRDTIHTRSLATATAVHQRKESQSPAVLHDNADNYRRLPFHELAELVQEPRHALREPMTAIFPHDNHRTGRRQQILLKQMTSRSADLTAQIHYTDVVLNQSHAAEKPRKRL